MRHQAFIDGLLDEMWKIAGFEDPQGANPEELVARSRMEVERIRREAKASPHVRDPRHKENILVKGKRSEMAKRLAKVRHKPFRRMIERIRTAKPSKFAKKWGTAAGAAAGFMVPGPGTVEAGILAGRKAADLPKWVNRAIKQARRQSKSRAKIREEVKAKVKARQKERVRAGSEKRRTAKVPPKTFIDKSKIVKKAQQAPMPGMGGMPPMMMIPPEILAQMGFNVEAEEPSFLQQMIPSLGLLGAGVGVGAAGAYAGAPVKKHLNALLAGIKSKLPKLKRMIGR